MPSRRRKRLRDLIRNQEGKCHYCGARIAAYSNGYALRWSMVKRQASVDHVQPLSRGGSNDDTNLVAACQECNQRKGSLTRDEFLAAR